MDLKVTCVIVADDLTGACDSAVQFAAAGLRTTVAIVPGAAGNQAEVLAFSTESRRLAPGQARGRIRKLAERVRARAEIVFKKIDSTLRGNTAVEIIAALEAFGCDAAVVNPAFPAMARLVEGGVLRVASDPGFAPVEIAAWLRQHGAEPCRHVLAGQIAGAIRSGARFVSLDAICADDLARTVAEGLALKKRILWAGSAGLAAALAWHARPETAAAARLPHIGGPILFILGSDHPVTMEQQCRLLAGGGAELLDGGGAEAGQVRAVLARGHHLVLRLAPGAVAPQRLAELLADCRPAAMVVSGGDTLSAVCRALEVRAIEPRREIAPGIPAGILRGGAWNGSPVVTKSGGFGAPDDLRRIGEVL